MPVCDHNHLAVGSKSLEDKLSHPKNPGGSTVAISIGNAIAILPMAIVLENARGLVHHETSLLHIGELVHPVKRGPYLEGHRGGNFVFANIAMSVLEDGTVSMETL